MARSIQRGGRRLALRLALLLSAGLGAAAPAEAAGARTHPVTIEDLMSLTDMKGLFVSPDGRYAVTLANRPRVKADTYDFHWVLAPLTATGPAVSAGDAGDPDFFDGRLGRDYRLDPYYATPARWAPDSRSFAYLRRSHGQVQIWRTRIRGLAQEQLTHNAADVEDFVWSPDGRELLFSTAASRGRLRRMQQSQEENGFRLTPTTSWSYQWQRPFLDRYAPVGGAPVIWVLDLATGAERKASPQARQLFRGLVSARDRIHAVAGGGGHLDIRLPLADPQATRDDPPRVIQRDGRKPAGCAPFGCDGYFVPVAQDGARARSWWLGEDLFLLRRNGWNEPGVSLWRWPAGRGQAHRVLRSDDNLTDCNVTGRRLVCLLQTPTAPRRIVAVDLGSGRLTTVFDANPQWRNVELGQTGWVRFADAAGHETYGVLVKPIGFRPGGRYPMVVIGYGVEDALYGDAAKRYPAQVLAAHGFVTLVYRMWEPEAADHDPKFLVRMYSSQATDGKVSYDQVAGLVSRLAREGVIDPARIGIGGHSEALNTIAWGLTHGDLFKTVATDWVRWNATRYFMPRDSYQAELQDGGLLRDPYDPPGKIIRDFSLSLHVRQVRAPILVNASGLELDATNQWEALRRFWDAGRPLEMHVAPDEGHVVFKPRLRWLEYRRNVQWFEYWLQGREARHPVDPGQYRRWDHMKAQIAAIRAASPERLAASPRPSPELEAQAGRGPAELRERERVQIGPERFPQWRGVVHSRH